MENVLKNNISALKYVSKMISDETGCNIIICDQEGIIIEATLQERIGNRHMGAVLILTGETDEAVISEEMEREYLKLGTDTRKGYNYVITILGKRVGSLGVAGEPEGLKPIVRIAAKTIGFYVSEYLREKEKNKILQKMARISDEIAQQSYGNINYQVFAEDILSISAAKYVFFEIYDQQNKLSNIVAVSGKARNIRKLNDLMGCPILGLKRQNSLPLRAENSGILTFSSLMEVPCNYIPQERCKEFAGVLGIGQVCILGIVYNDQILGNFILFMPKGDKLHNTILIELYAVQVGQLLMRAQAEAALKKSQDELKKALNILDSFWEHNPNPIAILDKRGKIIRASKSVSELLGLSPNYLEGNYLSKVFPQKVVDVLMDRITEYPVKKPLNFSDEVNLPDGTIRHYDSWLFPIANDKDETALVGLVAIDVTDRKKNEEQFKYLSQHDSLTGLYNRAFFENQMEKLDNQEYPLTIMVLDADGLKLINDSMGHDRGDMLLKNLARVVKSSLRESDILARTGGDEFVIILPKTDKQTAQMISKRINNSIQLHNQKDPSLPLSISMGMVTVEEPGQSSEDILRKADGLMYHNKIANMESSRNGIVNSLITALADRDYLAQGHGKRLLEHCVRLGERIKLPQKTITALSLLAKVHDLGNVGVPADILFKPGPLTIDEWETMQQHPEKGCRIAIASSSPDLKEIADLILKHHERWDGKGYPLGLMEEEIPIECRILAIADSYDAMINERPYRKARSRAAAIAEIKRCSGSQFDPELVKVFCEVVGEGI